MGYYYEQRSPQSFFVSAENVPAFQKTVAEYLGDSWPVWTFTYDDAGNCVEATMQSETKRYQYDLFEIVAPFVRNGSFLEIEGEEEDDLFRLVFNDGKIEKKTPKIVWEY